MLAHQIKEVIVNENGWDEYKLLVLTKLEDMRVAIKSLDEKVDTLQIEMSAIKVKSGIWGLVAGLIPVLVLLAIALIKGGLFN